MILVPKPHDYVYLAAMLVYVDVIMLVLHNATYGNISVKLELHFLTVSEQNGCICTALDISHALIVF